MMLVTSLSEVLLAIDSRPGLSLPFVGEGEGELILLECELVDEEDIWKAGLNNGKLEIGVNPLSRSTTECKVDREAKPELGVLKSGNDGKDNADGDDEGFNGRKVGMLFALAGDELCDDEIAAFEDVGDINDNLSEVNDFDTNSVNCSILINVI